ncbi:hypothetical protein [Leucobacter aridicollis]|uniref:hypothetical protein n=1 Tax=Leucobacter aridicollis TaxID=283878 RepID=UPI002105DA7C|nr:hypothetical protein [Leucobacter aridicollis]UTX53086.1 hypothetical protein KI794_15555 [Leucobacter aridicollis]
MRASGALSRAQRYAQILATVVGVVAILVVGAVLAGCSPQPAPESPQPTPATSPEPEPTPSEEPWVRFTDSRLPHSFEVPPGWTVADLGGNAEIGAFQFGVIDPEGRQLLTFASRVQGLGGACQELPVLRIQEADTRSVELQGYVAAAETPAPLVAPRVVYRISEVEDGALASLSLSDDIPPEACMYYNLLHTDAGLAMFATQLQVDSFDPAASPWLFGSVEEAKEYADTAEYEQLVRVLSSLSFTE